MVEAGHGLGRIRDADEWPWSWHRLISYVRIIKSVYERSAYTKDKARAIPPRWMFWEPEALDDHFDRMKG